MSIIGLLVILIVACVILWAARALLAAFSVGNPIATVVYVLLVVLLMFWILNALGVAVPGNIRLR